MSAPRTIGHYIVERELGRGAMGVVYLAEDTKLGRRVAIKALPSELALDPMRQMRFEREARTLAAVNHPNIGAIFGIEESQGARYLVLELVEGETLAERLAFAPVSEELGGVTALPVPEALDICRQVAAGMAAAHELGIIHRDLKPANVKIRPDGLVKVLDFGIARGGPVEPSLGPRVSSEAPTLAGPPDLATTQFGTIIGTPGYMSPEQTRGKPVGKATDLWSFGCMIFECLTGRVAFPGDSLADALAATLTMEPDFDTVPRRTPLRVLELIARCLEKDSRKRLAEFSEARAELERAMVELTSPPAPRGGAPESTLKLEPAPPGETEGWASTTGNLPVDDTSFLDRTGELAELVRLLSSSRQVSVVGAAGMGKTRLALAAARQVLGQFACGAWYVDGAPVASKAHLALQAALTLGARAAAGETTTGALARLIGKRRVLLILDSCQFAAPAGEELVGALLAACPRMTIMAVAREVLGLEGESVFRVPAMKVPAEPGARDGAVALLRERARVAKATLDATPESPAAMATLCRTLQGLPLPIELAAAWAETPTFEDVTARLSERMAVLGIAALETQPPDQIMRLLVDWAYHQVTEGERGMLRRLSVFAGGCTLRAAAAISGAADSFPDPQSDSPAGGPITQQEVRVMDLLARLNVLSLLSVRRSADGSPASTRFLLHEPVRQLARARLMEFTGSISVLKRHMLYYLALLDQAVPRLSGPDGPLWSARLSADLPNILVAMETAEATGEGANGARLREQLSGFLQSNALAMA